MDENELINTLLETKHSEGEYGTLVREVAPTSPSGYIDRPVNLSSCQWGVEPNGIFRATSATVSRLKAGVYGCGQDQHGFYLESKTIISDHILDLPDTANHRLLQRVRNFWDARERYQRFGYVHKMGAILMGPQGSGKTSNINLLVKELIERDGVVIYCTVPFATVELLKSLRAIEPDRNLIVVIEDIDEIIRECGENAVLSMLDGQDKISNVCFIATTNYPEKLGARIVNRPTRFDERIVVPMPSDNARRYYLEHTVPSLTAIDIDKWVQDTTGMGISHLRELVASVMCLDQQYDEVISRLRSMMKEPKPIDGYQTKSTLGYAAPASA